MRRKDDSIRVSVNSYGADRPLMLVYRDPTSGKKIAKSCGIKDTGKKARQDAAKEAGRWQEELNSGKYQAPSKISWNEFRKRVEQQKLADPNIADGTRDAYAAAFNTVERVLNPDKLCKMTTGVISRLVEELRKPRRLTKADGSTVTLPPLKESTIACHLRHLKAALRWAEQQGWMGKAPVFNMPAAGKAKERPITTEEFERMLAAVPAVRPNDPAVWTRYLNGLWLSGLRLEESLILSWDQDAAFCADLSAALPRVQNRGSAQKSRKTQTIAITPDMVELLRQTPEAERQGLIFPLAMTGDRVGKVVSAIGRKAGVITNKAEGKYASAHTLRRSFGTRWAQRVESAVLRQLMRHANIATTLTYYVDIDASETARDLWDRFGNNLATTGTSEEATGSAAATTEPVTPKQDNHQCPGGDLNSHAPKGGRF